MRVLFLLFCVSAMLSLVIAVTVSRSDTDESGILPGTSVDEPPKTSPAQDQSCQHCGNSERASSSDRVSSVIPGMSLFTPWVPADVRTPLENLDVIYTDQDGRKGTIRNLVTKPALITFFYSRCQNGHKCSAAVTRAAALQRRLEQVGILEQVRLLLITYEPQFDTPERIKRFGLDRGLRFDNALGVRLDPDGQKQLLDELEVPVNYNGDWVNTHGVALFLIDVRGKLARKYHTIIWDNDQVVRDIKQLLAEE